MKTRLSSALLVFLFITSIAIPAVSAEAPQIYYELHNLCLSNAKEDLGHIPYLNWGIGYNASIDGNSNNKWEVFVHAGSATKKFIITPETDLSKLVTLSDFVEYVDECRYETDQIPTSVLASLASSTTASVAFIAGGVYDNAYVAGSGTIPAGIAVDEARQSVDHWNSAKTAQKNAEKLFKEL